jgi:hypothetical protein
MIEKGASMGAKFVMDNSKSIVVSTRHKQPDGSHKALGWFWLNSTQRLDLARKMLSHDELVQLAYESTAKAT